MVIEEKEKEQIEKKRKKDLPFYRRFRPMGATSKNFRISGEFLGQLKMTKKISGNCSTNQNAE
jgi:hypothetical protein